MTKKSLNTRILRALAIVAGLTCAASVFADDFDLNWYTVDGGGWTWSSGGGFDLGGTIGQPDAGAMSGGDFELLGGFWPDGAAQNPCNGTTKGDSNCDGSVDFDDIDCFVAALIGQDAWENCGSNSGCDYTCANDIDENGDVTFDDIDGFVECLINQGCP